MSILKSLGKIDKALDKKAITLLAQNDASQVITSSQYDLLKVYVELKRYENYLSEVIEQIKPLALEVAKEQNEKKFGFESAKIQLQSRTSYNFSTDTKWVILNENVQVSQTEIKKHQEFLKNLKEVTEVIDQETGEVYEVSPPEITQSQLLIVSF